MIKKDMLSWIPGILYPIVFNSLMKFISAFLQILMWFLIADYIFEQRSLKLLFVVLVMKAIFQIPMYLSQNYIQKKMKMNLRLQVNEKILTLNRQDNDIRESELSFLSSEAVEQLSSYYSLYLPHLFYSFAAIVLYFIVLWPMYRKGALLLFFAIPLIPLSIVMIQSLAKKILNSYWKTYGNLSSVFLDSLKGMFELRIFKADAWMQEKLDDESESFRKRTMALLMMQLNSISVMDLIAYGASMLAILLGIKSGLNDKTMFLFIVIAADFFIPLRQLGSFFHLAMNGMSSYQAMQELLAYHPKASYLNYQEDESAYYFYDVSVKYGELVALDEMDFEVRKGETIVIVGESGSGKSSLAQVLSEDTDLELAYMDSDPFLFAGSVLDNLFCDDYEKARQLLDDLDLSYLSLDAEVEEFGKNLSGGEKQRIVFARYLLSDYDFYIFDEITASVDYRSEMAILRKIEDLKARGKTLILISHRLHHAYLADYVMVFENGRCVEGGMFESLKKDSRYFKNSYLKQVALERGLKHVEFN